MRPRPCHLPQHTVCLAAITPLVVRDKAPSLSKRRNHEIIDRMQLNHAEIFTSRAHYDGAKLLYSLRDVSASLVVCAFVSVPYTTPLQQCLHLPSLMSAWRVGDQTRLIV